MSESSEVAHQNMIRFAHNPCFCKINCLPPGSGQRALKHSNTRTLKWDIRCPGMSWLCEDLNLNLWTLNGRCWPRWTTLLGQQGLNGVFGPGCGRKEGSSASKKGAAPSPGNHYLRTKRSSRARKRQNFSFAGEQLSTIVRGMVDNRSKSFRLLGKNLKHWPIQYLTVDHNLKMSCQG